MRFSSPTIHKYPYTGHVWWVWATTGPVESSLEAVSTIHENIMNLEPKSLVSYEHIQYRPYRLNMVEQQTWCLPPCLDKRPMSIAFTTSHHEQQPICDPQLSSPKSSSHLSFCIPLDSTAPNSLAPPAPKPLPNRRAKEPDGPSNGAAVTPNDFRAVRVCSRETGLEEMERQVVVKTHMYVHAMFVVSIFRSG